ncbi:MAG: hypothetical protein NT007_14550 [Candidatus Kapabacteria bacterium]|nr:hypothetical protein [Candidatus Kapabacteria bacterium]
MNKTSSLIFAIAALLLVIVYFTPIWTIGLEAPQYPEGIGLKIMISGIEGKKPNDLQSLNGLNHYIGMQKINPESIVELKIMPYIILFFIVFGILIALVKKKILGWIWVGLFAMVGIVGLYDFYLWEFDYGHNLNPHAAIKVPGMTYQPPMIGSLQLLNFTATSYPGIGGIVIGLAILIAVYALLMKKKS